ncbi:YihY/virulence factor BrkB family protein [Halomonas sp. MCCC 1A17488]|uniref:YihY/virulence factor BrkB family protein n=1 Tax=Billgrantia sulfidoxydans TaxID=2733484 RepID=A0ABX7W815_9GAMM|nr:MULTISPECIES: YihY/virulence factor BrkB family protein [Halomonas]MCE8018465.1 YihY/virulence factor BrkB family protein [Halomonas sp. MCCC 1A17488]MCG3241798.1 YihY/virulence factor BrkB family protein [Halomonas sp. MCCC 1A17488]QPP49165.1 YihY/virulence factor BrkB family protein [Halomonas sp. SS10-MC5]QTP56499.1 YihY/virulence factor BrkB family protein [Halomonas sulfidoxydans]
MRKFWRGRRADNPHQIPGPGWLDVMWRVKAQLSHDRVNMLAAGIAFYALLSLFPAIGAVISLWALAFDPAEVASQIGEISRFMPPGGARLIHEQAREVSENTDTGLSLTALLGLAVAIFLASKGVRGLMVGLNVVYGEEDRRGLVHRMLVVAALTLGLILMSLAATVFVALYPLAIGWLALDGPLVTLIKWLRWPALLPLMMFVIAVLYRYGPYRRSPRWEWVSMGTVTATLLWLLGSGGLSLYVGQIASMDELYGSLGAVVVLMLWFWLSSYVVLLGAEINAEMERQTRRDTTVGASRPMGERGAYAADSLGRKRPWRRQRHQGEDP